MTEIRPSALSVPSAESIRAQALAGEFDRSKLPASDAVLPPVQAAHAPFDFSVPSQAIRQLGAIPVGAQASGTPPVPSYADVANRPVDLNALSTPVPSQVNGFAPKLTLTATDQDQRPTVAEIGGDKPPVPSFSSSEAPVKQASEARVDRMGIYPNSTNLQLRGALENAPNALGLTISGGPFGRNDTANAYGAAIDVARGVGTTTLNASGGVAFDAQGALAGTNGRVGATFSTDTPVRPGLTGTFRTDPTGKATGVGGEASLTIEQGGLSFGGVATIERDLPTDRTNTSFGIRLKQSF